MELGELEKKSGMDNKYFYEEFQKGELGEDKKCAKCTADG